jgi:Domain of unknown function (DUF4440)/Domain of unknown function (DUF3471)
MRRFILLLFCSIGVLALSACRSSHDVIQQQLTRRTQELFDSVAGGDQAPWRKYFADDCMYFDEVGKDKNKTALVADITPLPHGYSGSIRVVNVKSHIENDVAIMSYDLDESETVFGQELTARYHATDTWMRRNGDWQIVAGQIFRYYEDPAAGDVDDRTLMDYVGTYELAFGERLTISQEGSHLNRQRGNGSKVALIPESTAIFFRKGVEGRILFHRGKQGKVDALIDRRNNEDVVWKKI